MRQKSITIEKLDGGYLLDIPLPVKCPCGCGASFASYASGERRVEAGFEAVIALLREFFVDEDEKMAPTGPAKGGE